MKQLKIKANHLYSAIEFGIMDKYTMNRQMKMTQVRMLKMYPLA